VTVTVRRGSSTTDLTVTLCTLPTQATPSG